EPLPAWVERLSGLLLQCDSADDDDWVLSMVNSAEESLPFWEVWVPFVTQNTRELRRRAADNLGNLGEDALRTFQLQLLATLVHLAALSIHLVFRRFQVKCATC